MSHMQFNSNTAIVTLTSLTGLIHLFIGIVTYSDTGEFLDLMLLLNGISYFSFVIIFTLGFIMDKLNFIKERPKFFYIQYMGLTIVTIISYFVVWGSESFDEPIGPITKLIEVALVYFLYDKFRSL
ncbi:MAG: hypothetical protein IH840_16125 [Candidatus Heimdallarchaeota archaeon]|nr:hypothetical protein [Candidatus Heimdallarchaeota archaeon]